MLSATEITLSYGNQHLLKGVSLAVEDGEKVGLVGRNGCGKTSLLKILAGVESPNEGSLSIQRGIRIGYLPQEFELDQNATVLQNILSGAADLTAMMQRYEAGQGSEAELADLQHHIEAADGWNLESRIKAAATALGAPPLDALVGPLSGGEKRRVALCRALVSQPDLLLLDEPTNHLDAESIGWLEDFLRGFKGAVIFVTHDRYFLDVIATRILEIADGYCYSHPGNYTAYLESKSARQAIAEQSERRRQRFLRTELEWVRAGVKARGTKQRSRLENFYKIEGQEAPPEEREMDLLLPPAAQLGNVAVDLEDVGARVFDEDGRERWLFRHLTLSLKPGQCTGIIGRNGTGKTTLLRICLGERTTDEGKVTIGKKAAFNYIDQSRMQLTPGATVLQEVADQDEIVFFGTQKLSARGYLRRFLFQDERANERIDRLSGGERARLMLAKVLKRGGNIIVLDEPTNDLDLQSLRILEEALCNFDGTVLVVSHDRYFLDRVCDQIIAFEDGGVHCQVGNYSYYLEKRREREALLKAWSAPVKQQPSLTKSSNKPRKLTFKEARELEGMEEAILKDEAKAQELDAILNDPSFYITRSTEAEGLHAELDALREHITTLYARWEELEAIKAASGG